MLIRSDKVLDDENAAIAAAHHATTVMPDSLELQRQYVHLLIDVSQTSGTVLGAEAEPALRRLYDLNPISATALFHLGAIAMREQNPTSAVLYWDRLTEVLPKGSAQRRSVKKMLARLERADRQGRD